MVAGEDDIIVVGSWAVIVTKLSDFDAASTEEAKI
jgi:hypothetical protein